MAKISVAMAVYNGERYLKEQIDSILCQLKPQDELVISYDLSTDSTWAIINDYRNRYPGQIKLYVNNMPGIIGNFENAISHCLGEYIFISDQDDMWLLNKRDKIVNSFQTNDADMIIHNGVHINEVGNQVSQSFFSMHRIGPGKIRNILKPRYSGCCMAFKTGMVSTLLPIPPSVGAYDHWIGTIGEYFGRIEYIEDVLLYHRLHDNNATPKSRRTLLRVTIVRINLLYHLFCRYKKCKTH